MNNSVMMKTSTLS